MTYPRLEKLQRRRLDPSIVVAGLNEAYNKIDDEPAIKYAIGAMQPIDPQYTSNTFQEGDRIRNQLDKGLIAKNNPADFDYQGSVTNDTHIKAHSDIDLLVLIDKFYSVEPPYEPENPYSGDPLQDLKQLRKDSIKILTDAYPAVDIDTSGSKSISLQGGSLKRKVDVVISNWWNTVKYIETREKYHRGIRVLDNLQGTRINNKPFLHNKLLHDKDQQVSGNLKKVIRLLKSLKYDSDIQDTLSSYDIAAIAYSMPTASLNLLKGQELVLIQNCYNYLEYLGNDQHYKESLYVPNKTRKVFCEEGAKNLQLRGMTQDVKELLSEIEEGLSRSFRNLSEARIAY